MSVSVSSGVHKFLVCYKQFSVSVTNCLFPVHSVNSS